MRRTPWSHLRSIAQPDLDLELRVCLELLSGLPEETPSAHIYLLPSNVLVDREGRVVIAAERSGSGELERNRRYLAPELEAGHPPSLATAIYSVGVLLFEAVTGCQFESHQAVLVEIEGSRAMARATGLGTDYWEILLLEAAATATVEPPERRWSTPTAFAQEIVHIAGSRIRTRDGLGAWVAEHALTSSRLASSPRVGVSHLPRSGAAAPASSPPAPADGRKTLRGIALDLSCYPEVEVVEARYSSRGTRSSGGAPEGRYRSLPGRGEVAVAATERPEGDHSPPLSRAAFGADASAAVSGPSTPTVTQVIGQQTHINASMPRQHLGARGVLAVALVGVAALAPLAVHFTGVGTEDVVEASATTAPVMLRPRAAAVPHVVAAIPSPTERTPATATTSEVVVSFAEEQAAEVSADEAPPAAGVAVPRPPTGVAPQPAARAPSHGVNRASVPVPQPGPAEPKAPTAESADYGI